MGRLLRIAAVFACLAWLTGCSTDDEALPAENRAADLNGLTLARLEGGEVPLSDWRGRVLIINIWATWCAPCREEMPALQALSERLDPDRFAVLGISVDQDLNLIREFMLKYGIAFPQFVDPDMVMASERLGVNVLPETLVIDADGRLFRRITGYREWNDAEFLETILPQEAGRG